MEKSDFIPHNQLLGDTKISTNYKMIQTSEVWIMKDCIKKPVMEISLLSVEFSKIYQLLAKLVADPLPESSVNWFYYGKVSGNFPEWLLFVMKTLNAGSYSCSLRCLWLSICNFDV